MITNSHAEIARFREAFLAMPEDERPSLDLETIDSVLDAAGRLADEVLAPLDTVADTQGCRVVDGHVIAPDGFRAALDAVAEGGWVGLILPEIYGGSELPIALKAMTFGLFDRASHAFNMITGSAISAAVLLHEHAPKEVAMDWIPALIDGTRTATICISESDAGSDVGRMRTRAEKDGDTWRIYGNKQWISYGDHDLVDRIGHCLLARTSDAPGGRGLSLFLVPNKKDDGADNGISLIRIEEKVGLHGSPTCALSFDGSEAIMLGTPERGLPQLFTMISMMRLQVACQGFAAAARCTEIAENYAAERLQGGDPKLPPVAINTHPDVKRQLAVMRGKTEVMRAVLLQLTTYLERASEDEDAGALAQFLLPLAKAHGAETGFDVANAAIQVLGGAGFTKEWPVEQTLRDVRVTSIYEGTTGMQAMDLLERRLMRDTRGYEAFQTRATGPVATAFYELVKEVCAAPTEHRLAAADAVLRAAWCAITEWMGPRLPADAQYVIEDCADQFALYAARARRALK